MKKILVVVSSVRKNRVADKVLEATKQELLNYKDFEVEVADFKSMPLPFFDNERSTSAPDFKPEDANVQEWTDMVKQSDAVLILAAEYNYSYTAVLKNAVDWVPGHIWENKPISFIGYGWSGGSRAITNLRNLFSDFIKAAPSDKEASLRFTKEIDLDGSIIDEQATKTAIKIALDSLN